MTLDPRSHESYRYTIQYKEQYVEYTQVTLKDDTVARNLHTVHLQSLP